MVRSGEEGVGRGKSSFQVVLLGALCALAGCASRPRVAELTAGRSGFSCAADGLLLSIRLLARCPDESCLPVEFSLPSTERVVIQDVRRRRLDNTDIHHEFGPYSYGGGVRSL